MTGNPFQEEALRRLDALFSRFQDGAVSDIRRQVTDSGYLEIDIIPTHPEYFPVGIEICEDDIRFSCGGMWHEAPSASGDDHIVNQQERTWTPSYFDDEITMLEKIFSGRVCIEERRAGGKPYGARYDILDEDGKWKFRGAQGAVFFHDFGKWENIRRYCPLFADHVPLP